MSLNDYHFIARTPDPGAPLIFVFHGTGGNEFQFFEPVGEMVPGAGVIAPRGDVDEYGASRFFRRTAEGVYDMDDLAFRTKKMGDFIRAHKSANGDVPVYGIGYSNGANILASIVLKEPELFDRAVIMHPLIPWTPPPQPALSALEILITAGERDPICPLPVTQALADYFKAQGADVALHLHGGGHEIRDEELVKAAAFLSVAPRARTDRDHGPSEVRS